MFISKPEDLLIVERFIKSQGMVGYDVETNGLDPHTNKVLLIQIGTERQQYVLDVARLGTSIFSVLELIAKPNTAKIAHNAKFDYVMTRANFGIDMKNMKDTLLADYLLTQGKNIPKHSFDVVVDKYLGETVSKDLQKSFIGMKFGDKFSEEQIKYAGDDVKYLLPLHAKMDTLIKQRNMSKLAYLENSTVRATAELELNGIHLDNDRWLALKDLALVAAIDLKVELDEHFKNYCSTDLFGSPVVNYDSPKQMLELLPKVCNITLTSTNKQELEKQNHDVINLLLEYRKRKKLVTTYGQQFLDDNVHPITGRVHSSFWQLGNTDSGRYASTKPNMQNIPKEAVYRAAFTAQDLDYRIVAADFANQELRLLAHMSGEDKFIHCLKTGKDLHAYCAAVLFNRNYDSITTEERNAAKAINFGVIYGMGAKRLSAVLKITVQEASELLRSYFLTFPKIDKLLKEFTEQAQELKYALSPLDGRRRDLGSMDFDNPKHLSHAMNIAKNLPFQGTGASVTKRALWKTSESIRDNRYDAMIINAVHDEILLEVHKDEVNEVAEMLSKEMIKAFNFYAPSVPMEVKPVIGDCWIH